MKKFIFKIAAFGAIFFGLALIFEFYVFPFNNNQMGLKYELLQQEDTEVLVLGNSHLFFGINPAASSYKMINVANKGRKLETDYQLLKSYQAQLPNLSYVIVPILQYTLLSDTLSEQEKRLYYRFFRLDAYKQKGFKNYLLCNEPFWELVDNTFFGNKQNHNQEVSVFDWHASKANYKDQETTIKARIERVEGKVTEEKKILDSNVALLKAFISTQNKQNYTLIFVTPPYHPDYYKNADAAYHKKLDKMLANLAIENNQVLYISGKSLKLDADRYFTDSDHLNVLGANVYTKKIDSVLKAIQY
jgi:hypothetical protein